MSSKKIIFFIVEGASDETAVANALEKIFKKNQISVQITEGDITSDIGTTPQNIKSKIVEQIKKQFKPPTFTPNDFIEVVQLVDMDGVFIDDSKVVYEEVDKLYYGSDSIKCKDRDATIKRNKKKVANLKALINLKKVWRTIPYSVYFFSSNLDHVLHDDSNLKDDKKTDMAWKFAKKYENDIKGFMEFFSNEEYAVKGTYDETWNFITADSNSLKRFTNFHLLFSEQSKNKTNECISNEYLNV